MSHTPPHVRMRIALLSVLAGVSLTRTASAANPPPTPSVCPICHRANNQQAPYGEKAAFTLVRGATNTAFGWTELLVEPANEVQHGGNLAVGIGKGVQQTVKRTAEGLGELLTFWVPKGPKGYPKISTDCPICFPTSQHPAPPPPTKP